MDTDMGHLAQSIKVRHDQVLRGASSDATMQMEACLICYLCRNHVGA